MSMTSRSKKVSLTIFIALIFCGVGFYVLFYKSCSEKVILVKKGFGDRLKVNLSSRNCGATTPILYSLSVESSETNKLLLKAEGVEIDKIKWISDTKLLVPTKRVHSFTDFFYFYENEKLLELKVVLDQ